MALPLLASCGKGGVEIEIMNPSKSDRTAELAEVDLATLKSDLSLEEGETFVLKGADGKELPYQITYDGKVVFSVQLKAGEKISVVFQKGTPAPVDAVASGKVYTERYDDLSWENDKVGFRAYGPGLERSDEWVNGKMYGYDLFPKRGTDRPVLDLLYGPELALGQVDHYRELVKTDPARAKELRAQKSYHVDHGYGMDCYAVGPTLGAGTTALVDNGKILFPECYETCEILDKGPLRFTVRLAFKATPITYETEMVAAEGEAPVKKQVTDTVREVRLITLDAGSYLNKTVVVYEGLSRNMPLIAGVAVRDNDGEMHTGIDRKYISYVAPTNVDPSVAGTGVDNGNLFLGHVYAQPASETRMEHYDFNGQDFKHFVAESTYAKDSKGFTYWWGFGWDKSDVKNIEDWNTYLKSFSAGVGTPLKVKAKEGFIESIFSYIIGLGAAVMMPVIFTILGLCIGIKFSKALKSGLLVGVGFVGLSVVTALLTSSLGPVLEAVVLKYDLQLNVFDMGWPSAASVAYNTSVGAFIIPVCLLVNIIMLLTKTTRTVNIDLWNYWHFAFIGAIVYFAMDHSLLWGFFAAVVCYIITLVLADATSKKFQKFYDGMDGISIPQPFCQGFVPFAWLINKCLDWIPGFNKLHIDAEGMKKKFGLLGEPLFLGILVGAIIAAFSYKGWSDIVNHIPQILGLGIKMGAVMELIPRITSLFIEGLKPISEATKELIGKKFKGAAGLNIGMSPALVIGHPATLVVSLLLIPVTLLLAVFLPGNEFLPLASLAGMFYVFPLILPITKGNVLKTFIIGLIMMVGGLYMVTNLAPYFTLAAQDVYAVTGDAAVAIPNGFSGGALDFASSPLAWIIFHLTHSFKWVGVVILVLVTSFLMVLNRRAIVKYQKELAENENGGAASDKKEE